MSTLTRRRSQLPFGIKPNQHVNTHSDKVLVLGSDTRAFLTVIRSLGRSGKEVHVAWNARDSVAIHSKYVHTTHALSRPPSEGWQAELKALLDREQFDLVIPCNDPSILPLHDNRHPCARTQNVRSLVEMDVTMMSKERHTSRPNWFGVIADDPSPKTRLPRFLAPRHEPRS